MAIRRLFNMLSVLAGGDNPQVIRNDLVMGRGPAAVQESGTVVGEARIVAVGPFETAVEYRGRVEFVGHATDEPFRAGQEVWVAPVKGGGFVTLGSK